MLARFAVVGASNTLLTLAVYALLLAVGLHYLAALVPAYAVGALNGYTLNRAWTFRTGAFRSHDLGRYALVQCAALALNAALLAVLVGDVGVDKVLAQIVALGVVTCLAFLASRHWVFAR
jgi:putative flippase GtrA